MTHFTCKAAKVFLFTALSAVVMTSFAAADSDLAVGLGKTTGSGLRMREQPTTEADIVYKMEKGTTVAILEEDDEDDDGWLHVTFSGKTGYVSGDYVDMINGDVKTYAQVNGSDVYVRADPNDDADILNTIDNNAYVTVLGLEDGWYAVKCKYGTEGYIRSDFLNLTSTNGETTSASRTSSGSSTASAKANSVVSIALSKKGSRYIYGAAGPYSFDCSGFTQWVYKKVGVSIPRTASQQWLNGPGTRVYKMSALQPGDLVYFRNPRYANGKACSHAAVYIGNGKIIHASSSRTGVIISNIYGGTYPKYFVGGRHIV